MRGAQVTCKVEAGMQIPRVLVTLLQAGGVQGHPPSAYTNRDPPEPPPLQAAGGDPSPCSPNPLLFAEPHRFGSREGFWGGTLPSPRPWVLQVGDTRGGGHTGCHPPTRVQHAGRFALAPGILPAGSQAGEGAPEDFFWGKKKKGCVKKWLPAPSWQPAEPPRAG